MSIYAQKLSHKHNKIIKCKAKMQLINVNKW